MWQWLYEDYVMQGIAKKTGIEVYTWLLEIIWQLCIEMRIMEHFWISWLIWKTIQNLRRWRYQFRWKSIVLYHKKNEFSSKPPTQHQCHLIVKRLSFDEAKAARKRSKRQACLKKTIVAFNRFLISCLLEDGGDLMTTWSPEVLSAIAVLELYKCQW